MSQLGTGSSVIGCIKIITSFRLCEEQRQKENSYIETNLCNLNIATTEFKYYS